MCLKILYLHMLTKSAVRAGSAATVAEAVKQTKYRYFTDRYRLEAVAVETVGTNSDGTKNIITIIDVGCLKLQEIGVRSFG